MAGSADLDQIKRQITHLELLQHKHSNAGHEVLVPIEQALALAYIAREIGKRP